MEKSYYLDLIGRQLAGEIRPEARRELEAWVHADPANQALYDEITRLWNASSDYELPPFETDTDQAWASLEQRLDQGGAKTIGMSRWFRYAAALVLLIVAGYGIVSLSFGEEEALAASFITSVRTAGSQQQEFLLPDGSTVVLNERSVLQYDTLFTSRAVTLKGEAFFDIQRDEDRPFRIESGETTTTVLGTSFNVRAYPEEAEIAVSVKEGKVRVAKSSQKTDTVILTAGQSGIYRKPSELLEKASRTNALAWKTQELHFEGTPLTEAAAAIERYFGVTIQVDNRQLGECRFKGHFKQPDLSSLLQAIAYTMDLEVESSNGAYVLKGDAKCN